MDRTLFWQGQLVGHTPSRPLACSGHYVIGPATQLPGARKPVRTEWRISGRWRVRDQTDHIQAGARRVCEYFAKRPHNILELTDQAQKLLLGASHSHCSAHLSTISIIIRDVLLFKHHKV